jgi:hypothetical protein
VEDQDDGVMRGHASPRGGEVSERQLRVSFNASLPQLHGRAGYFDQPVPFERWTAPVKDKPHP